VISREGGKEKPDGEKGEEGREAHADLLLLPAQHGIERGEKERGGETTGRGGKGDDCDLGHLVHPSEGGKGGKKKSPGEQGKKSVVPPKQEAREGLEA